MSLLVKNYYPEHAEDVLSWLVCVSTLYFGLNTQTELWTVALRVLRFYSVCSEMLKQSQVSFLL